MGGGLRLLLDTHTLIWWTAADAKLTPAAHRAILDDQNSVFVSAASAWEIATKVRLGKLPDAVELASDIEGNIRLEGFAQLAVSIRHAQFAGAFAGAHKDPFDRMLIAQALVEGLTLVSNETSFDAYGVMRLW